MESSFRLTPDELTAVFVRAGDQAFITTRPSLSARFDAPTEIATGGSFYTASITADGLTVFMDCEDGRMCKVTRPSKSAPFGPVTELAYPCVVADEYLYTCHSSFTSDGARSYLLTYPTPSGPGLYVTQRDLVTDTFSVGAQQLVTELYSPAVWADWPVLTDDALTLFIVLDWPWNPRTQMARRKTTDEPFKLWTDLDVLDWPSSPSWISPDACRLYLNGGDGDVYVASQMP